MTVSLTVFPSFFFLEGGGGGGEGAEGGGSVTFEISKALIEHIFVFNEAVILSFTIKFLANFKFFC